ncbi:MAG: hypothetical protein FJY97_18935 [candidate division Zixibacteria bacterium]|nr:hypothetical protein [candidate division Zixibacteria bacterium]
MEVHAGPHRYRWIDRWATFPDTETARTGWCHPGIVVTDAGDVLTTHPGEPVVLSFDAKGRLTGSWRTDLAEVHHILRVRENGEERLWLTDNGSKRLPSLGYEYPSDSPTRSGRVIKTTLDGHVLMELALPDLPEYRDSRCAVTAVAVAEEGWGANGDIFVADGYGQNYVHRYTRTGHYIGRLDGTEGAGRFSCPHGVFIDTRKPSPELYVADRANHRVQVYDLDGRFIRVFGDDYLNLPSTFATHEDRLVIGELKARLTLLDASDRFVGHLGANTSVCDVAGWPNNRDEQERVIPSRLLVPGLFNSPHGLASDAQGNLYVSEWLIGGRLTKLEKIA